MDPKETTDTKGTFTHTSINSKQFNLVRHAQLSKSLIVQISTV
jgi:hypothetical protein